MENTKDYSLYELLASPVWVCDDEATIVFVNGAFVEKTGLTTTEVVGLQTDAFFTTIIHPAHLSSVQEKVEELLEYGEDLENLEVKIKCVGGTYMWTIWGIRLVGGRPVENSDRIQGCVGVINDVSMYDAEIERRFNSFRTQRHLSAIENEINEALSSQMLEKQEEKAETLVELLFDYLDAKENGAIPDPKFHKSYTECIAFVDADLTIRYVNDLFPIWYGIAAGKGVGQPIDILISDEDILRLVKEKVDLLLDGEFPSDSLPQGFNIGWTQKTKYFQERAINCYIIPSLKIADDDEYDEEVEEEEDGEPLELAHVDGFALCLFDTTEHRKMANKFSETSSTIDNRGSMSFSESGTFGIYKSPVAYGSAKNSPGISLSTQRTPVSNIRPDSQVLDLRKALLKGGVNGDKSRTKSGTYSPSPFSGPSNTVDLEPTLNCHFRFPSYDLIYVNDRYRLFFNADDKSDLIGTSFQALLNSEDREKTREHLSIIYNDRMLGVLSQNQKDKPIYHKYSRVRGETRWIRWHFQLQFDKNIQGGYYFRGIGIDVTKRMSAQNEIGNPTSLIDMTPFSPRRRLSGGSQTLTPEVLEACGISPARSTCENPNELGQLEFVAWSVFLRKPVALKDISGEVKFDIKDCTVHISENCEVLLGYDEVGFVENPSLLFDIIHPEDIKVYIKCYERAIKNKKSSQVVRVILPCGEMRWFSCKVSPLKSETDEDEARNDDIIKGIEVVAQDVTDKTHAVEMIKLQTDMVESMSSGVCLIRQRDGIIVYHNPFFGDMMGMKEEAGLVGQHIATIIDDSDPSVVYGDCRDSLTNIAKEIDEVSVAKEEKKKMKKNQKQGEEAKDNEMVRHKKKKEKPGHSSHVFEHANADSHSDHMEPLYNTIYKAMSEKGEWKGDFVGRTRSGATLWLSTQVTIFNHSVYGLVWVWVQVDVTERRLVQIAISKAREAAMQSVKAKSSFLACMSHEIRTPMNGVIGMVRLLMDTELTAEQREFCESVQMCGDHMLQVINDILDFSKFESGNVQLEYIPLDIYTVIEEAMDLVYDRVKHEALDLVYTIGPNVPVTIHGDSTRLRQILVNLASNALKFTKKGGVSIYVEDVTDKIIYRGIEEEDESDSQQSDDLSDDSPMVNYKEYKFSVHDTGIGIPKDKQNKLFKAFSQVESSTTREFGGTGLGLAICSKLVEAMKGNIWVESDAGSGTTFCFTVKVKNENGGAPSECNSPRLDERLLARKSRDGAVSPHMRSRRASTVSNTETESKPDPDSAFVVGKEHTIEGKKIVVVDDSAMIRDAVCDMCRMWGMDVQTATFDTIEEVSEKLKAKKWLPQVALIATKRRKDNKEKDARSNEEKEKEKEKKDIDPVFIAKLCKTWSNNDCVNIAMNSMTDESILSSEAFKEVFHVHSIIKPIRNSVLLNFLRSVCRKTEVVHVLDRKNEMKLNSKLSELYPVKILIAEDNKINQKLIIRVMAKLGYGKDLVTLVDDGLKAVNKVKEETFDIVFMDMQMPVMDGITATKTIRSHFESLGDSDPHHLYIIAMTANAMDQDRMRCIEAGMDDYLSKPISFSKLQKQIEIVGELMIADGHEF